VLHISVEQRDLLVHRTDHTDPSDLHASGAPFRLSADNKKEKGRGVLDVVYAFGNSPG
jgi:hypothetical protein